MLNKSHMLFNHATSSSENRNFLGFQPHPRKWNSRPKIERDLVCYTFCFISWFLLNLVQFYVIFQGFLFQWLQ